MATGRARDRIFSLLILAALLVPALPAGAPAAEATAPQAITVERTEDAIEVHAPAYRAVVDRPHGNLIAVHNDAGHRLVGTNGSGIQGVVASWRGGSQQDGASQVDPEIRVEGTTVTVDHPRFRETYLFRRDHVEVRVEARGQTLPGDTLSVLAGSVLEPSRDAARRWTFGSYRNLSAYPTDFATDRSQGQFGLWTTNTYTVPGHTYKAVMAEPTLEGRCRWWTMKGRVVVSDSPAHDVASPTYREACYVGNQTDVEAEGVVVRGAIHQVLQEFAGLQDGDVLAFRIGVDASGYDVRHVDIPVSTRLSNVTDQRTHAKVMVPWDKPEEGYRLAIFHPGHWDSLNTHSYLWDLLANHGFIVATPWTRADMGDDHGLHDWGYMMQVEFRDLRHWVMRNHDVDRDRVVGIGISEGGLNVLLDSINHPHAYAATIFYDGVYDFERFWTGSAFGAASTAAGLEIGPCCGRMPSYAWDIRNPKERIDNLRGDLFIVHGAADVVAPQDQSLELHHDVPGSELHLAAGAHENDVFAAFRKEALDVILDAERSDAQRDRVDATFYGRPEKVTDGYEPLPDERNFATSWLKVWVPDGTFAHVEAARTDEGVTVRSDEAVRVAVRLPEACAPDCRVTVNGEPVDVREVRFVDEGPAAVFDVGPGETVQPSFADALPASPAGETLPVDGLLPLIGLLVAWAVVGRR